MTKLRDSSWLAPVQARAAGRRWIGVADDMSVTPLPWSAASAAEIAAAAGARDMFVFRRIAGRRFAHIGGAGRGAGWAGIVEVGVEDEPLVGAVFAGALVVRRSRPQPWHVIGPYYGHEVAAVPVNQDLFVLFGGDSGRIAAVSDDELLELARFAGEALTEVEPAKRLADELETLHAVQDLLRASAETFEDAAQCLVDHCAAALSCDLALLWLRDEERLLVCDRRERQPPLRKAVASALAAIAENGTFPLCIQEATGRELPPPFRSADGVLAYYVLEVERPVPGILLLLHTAAGTPRGFTLLCQSLGQKLVTAAEPLLTAALMRDRLRDDLDRAAEQARRDPLTGLANRLAWSEALDSTTACAASPVSIVQLDCRGLKLINDTQGHPVGDQVLCRVAAVLASSVRDGDLVARLGGDEFGILLCGADEETTRTVVARIEATLANERGDSQHRICLAIGTTTSRDGQLEAAQQEADAAMVKAKRSSGDRGRPRLIA